MRSTGQFSPSTFSKNRGLERVLGGTKGVFRRLDTINSSTQHKHKHQHDSHRIGCNNHNSNLSFRNDYDDDGRSIYGYSKLNRITEHFGRRGAIQEQLTVAIHNAVNKLVDNIGVMVMIDATHNCVSCRGIKHQGASMVTSEVSGVFANHEKTAKQEVLSLIMMK